ncbi:MAG: SMP-30/gluconolactonase/LRE family protein [Pseudomonadota bacterium]
MQNFINTHPLKLIPLALAVSVLTACGGSEQTATDTQAPASVAPPAAPPAAAVPPATDCADTSGLTYICGPQGAEDLLSLGGTGRILASGMSGQNTPGHMYLVDPSTMEYEELIHGSNFSQAPDTAMFPGCPGPLNLQSFSVHGLSISEVMPGVFSVYTTSHGEREAIEVYELNVTGAAPAVAWKGCVVLPANTFANSVARLADGGFVTTKMMDPTAGFASIASGGITGVVYEWHPGGTVTAIEGTELSGANGIAVSDDERFIYVAAFGTREIVKFDRSTMPIGKQTVSIDIVPDNIRWGSAGKLLTAGGNYVSPDVCTGPTCATGWSILEVDAETLAVTKIGGADQNASIQGVSSALQVGNNLWVGSFNDDRIGYLPRQ